MSHAVVLVNVGRMADLVDEGYAEDESDIPTKAYLEGREALEVNGPLMDLMAPYDENTSVPRYRDYDTKREKAHKIISVTKDWEKYKATLDVRFRPLPLAGRALYPDPQAVSEERWRESFRVQEAAEEAIADLYTDEEVVAAYNAYWAQHDGGSDEKYYVGEAPDAEHTGIYHWSTYNPQSKWDWYEVGGRWDGMLVRKDVDHTPWEDPNALVEEVGGVSVALARDLDWEFMFEKNILPTFAYLDEARGWVENGRLIWFGMSTDEKMNKDQWEHQFRDWVAQLPEDAVIAVVDYHI